MQLFRLTITPQKMLGSGSYGEVVQGLVYGTPVGVKLSRAVATVDIDRSL